jgi:hypothetical protein
MSLDIYKVEWTNLHYPGLIGEKELDFLADFKNDEDGTYYLDGELLDEIVATLEEEGDEPPRELVEFLKARLNDQEDYRDMTITLG